MLFAPPPKGTPGPPYRQASLTRPSAAAAGCAVVVTQRKNAGGMCCLLHPQARPGRHSARPPSLGPAPQQLAEPSLSDSRYGRRGGHVLAAPPPCMSGPPQRQASLTRPSAAAAGCAVVVTHRSVVWPPIIRPPCAAMSASSIAFAPATSFSCRMPSAIARSRAPPRQGAARHAPGAAGRGGASQPWERCPHHPSQRGRAGRSTAGNHSAGSAE